MHNLVRSRNSLTQAHESAQTVQLLN